MQHLYPFEKHPKPKGTCPECQSKKAFRYFEGLNRKYGKCDRQNNCSYELIPTKETITPQDITSKSDNFETVKKVKSIYPEPKVCAEIIDNLTSNFHSATRQIGITDEHFKAWNCGTKQNKTCFVYKNIDLRYVNIVQNTCQVVSETKKCFHIR